MRCTKCGHTLSPDAEYCPSCGAPASSHPAGSSKPSASTFEDLLSSLSIHWRGSSNAGNTAPEAPLTQPDEPDLQPTAAEEDSPVSADVLNAALLEAVGSILQNADTAEDTAAQTDAPAEETPAEAAFVLPDPKQDALADSIEAAVAAAISTLTVPADTAAPQGAPAPDSVPDDTAPLPLPEEVTAAIPEPAPLASAKPAEEAPHPSSDQAPEDDTMKASSKKRRRQKHPFRFIYTLPTLLVAVLLLVGAVLFAVKSLLTPIEMPEKPAEQQANNADEEGAAVVNGIAFEFL
ncbi:MAG: zinc-ribbon domain-containing protein [Butyricicoccaceae bacterium]